MKAVRSVLVFGSGLEGWMAAALLARSLPPTVTVTLLDAGAGSELDAALEEPGVEATLPAITGFHRRLGLNDKALLDDGIASPTLATHYQAADAWVPFEPPGFVMAGLPFHHYAAHARRPGAESSGYDRFSLAAQAARRQRYHPQSEDSGSLLSTLSSGLQLNRERYRALVMALAQKAGVRTLSGSVNNIEREGDTITHLYLHSGECLQADLFVDTQGALLDALGVAPEPLDSAADLSIEPVETLLPETALPFSRVIQEDGGWVIERAAPGRLERYRLATSSALPGTGYHRVAPWTGNTVGVGKAAGALEAFVTGPLHWLQTGVIRLLDAFPVSTDWKATRKEYNRRTALEWSDRRAFFELHCYVAARSQPNSAFWQQRWTRVDNPELVRWLRLFENTGLVASGELQALPDTLRVSLLLCHDLWPATCDPQVAARDPEDVFRELEKMRALVDRAADQLPAYP